MAQDTMDNYKFLSPRTIEIKKEHEIKYPMFPWKYAYRKTHGFEKFYKGNEKLASHLEYSHTEEFNAYLRLKYIVRVDKEPNTSHEINHIITGGHFTWDYNSSILLTKGMATQELFYAIEYQLGYTSDGPVAHYRLRPTLKGMWAAFLFPKGYKLDYFPDIK